MKIGNFEYKLSTSKGKKLMTVYKGKVIHFGSTTNEHYKDRTGIWKDKDHLDPKRRANYLNRSAGIVRKDGTRTKDDPSSANYHARRVLW